MTAEPVVEIRPLREDDLDAVVELMAAHAAFEEAAFSPTGKADRLAQIFLVDEVGWCDVASVDGRVVGYTTSALELSTWDADHFLHLDTLYVDADHRDHRLGARLVEAIRRRAVALGVREVQWQTPTWNEGAIRFYERLGATATPKVRFRLPVDGDPSRA